MSAAFNRTLAALLAVAALVLAAGCGGGSSNAGKAPTDTAVQTGTGAKATGTTGAPAKVGTCVSLSSSSDLNRALLKHIVLGGARLNKLEASPTASPTFYYVSAALSGSGTKHLLATWVTRDLSGHKPIYSVDANAALVSLFGASSQEDESLSVNDPASVRSRRCVDGASATAGSPAPSGGHGGAPAGQ